MFNPILDQFTTRFLGKGIVITNSASATSIDGLRKLLNRNTFDTVKRYNLAKCAA